MSNFIRIKTNGGTIEINPLQIPSIIVREIQQPKGFVVNINIMPGKALYLETDNKTVFETKAEAEAAKDLLIAELNAAMDTGGTPTSKLFNRIRIFNEQEELITTQVLYEGEKVLPLDKPGYLFDFGTQNEFDFNAIITEDIDLTYSEEPGDVEIPPQTL